MAARTVDEVSLTIAGARSGVAATSSDSPTRAWRSSAAVMSRSRSARKAPVAVPRREARGSGLEFGVGRAEPIPQLRREAMVGDEAWPCVEMAATWRMSCSMEFRGPRRRRVPRGGRRSRAGCGLRRDRRGCGHVGVVVVEGCPSDPGLLGDGDHGHSGESLLGDEGEGRLDDAFLGRCHRAPIL